MKNKNIKLYVLLSLLFILSTTSFVSASSISTPKFNTSTYTHTSIFGNNYASAIIVDGIDVSQWQKSNIDWALVKRSGVDFAIIRVGGRFTSSGEIYYDDYYESNIKNALAAGLQVGVYFYSQAINTIEAVAEAQYLYDHIKNYGSAITLPLVMDYEYGPNHAGRLVDASLEKEKATKICTAFCDKIKSFGYTPMVYANYYFLTKSINGLELGNSYKVWLAHYEKSSSYPYKYDFWQYGSNGKIQGISGSVDCNFWYLNTNIIPVASSISNCTLTLSSTSYTYTSYLNKPTVIVKTGTKVLNEGTDYKLFYLANANAGTGQVMIYGMGKYTGYKLTPFKIKTQSFQNITVNSISTPTYTGKAVSPTLGITYKGMTLKKNIDYTITTANSIEAGTGKATVKIIGKRNFDGSVITKTFSIKKGTQTITTPCTKYSKAFASAPFAISSKTNGGAKLSYSSSNTSVATISSSGIVTVHGVGTATITVKAAETSNYNSVTKTLAVSVVKGTEKIAINETTPTTRNYSDSSFNLHATKIGDGSFKYCSSNTSVATISSNGKVTFISEGTTSITVTTDATANFNNAISIPIKLTVVGGPTKFTGTTSYSKGISCKPFTLNLTASSAANLTYKSSNTKILTVSNTGLVTTKGIGIATIKVSAPTINGYYASAKVISFKVKPNTQVVSVRNSSRGKLKIAFKKTANVSGYEIKYSTSKTFKSNVATAFVKTSNASSKTFKVYHPGHTYYAKVRSYYTLKNHTKIYGSYSIVKSIKVR